MTSSWILNDQQVFESEIVQRLPCLTHGFGSRNSIGWPGAYTNVKQIHSDRVVVAHSTEGLIAEGDALITSGSPSLVGVRTADCVPLLLVDPDKRAVAAVHAGWRGTVARIALKTVDRLGEEFGSSPDRLLAAIGPSIGKCCFEVGPEVAEKFGLQGTTHVDLVEANAQQLREAGLSPENIDIAGLCTMCDGNRFHSFRRDKESAGRMVAAIGLR